MKTQILLLLLMVAWCGCQLQAQTDTAKGSDDAGWLAGVRSVVNVSGEAGLYGELYGINGMAQRRPARTGRVFLRPTLTLFNSFSMAFDFFLSTEGNAAKQQMDKLAVHPSWGWGQAHLGDFTHELSKYTVSGVPLRGAGIEINPGIFRLQLLAGQLQRAVQGTPFESAYARYLYAAKLGIGKKESSHLDFNVLRAGDDIASVPRDRFITLRPDSVLQGGVYLPRTDTIYNGATPQENLVVGTNFQLKLFSGVVQLKGEAAGSVYTKDMYSSQLSDKDLPDFVKEIYRPRLSSNADYAYNADLAFQQRGFTAKAGYKVIGPGYTSLGLPSMINDKRIIDGALGMQFWQGALTLRGGVTRQSDNLLQQKLNTTTRDDISFSAGVRPAAELMLSLNYVRNNVANTVTNDTFKLHNINNSYTLTGNLQMELFGLKHTILGTYAYQSFTDKNILRSGNGVQSQNILLTVSTVVNRAWNASAGMQLNTVTAQSQAKSNLGLNARLANRALGNALSSSVAYSFTTSSASTSSNIQVNSTFAIDARNSIVLNLRYTVFEGKPPAQYAFTETMSSLGYTIRF